MGLRFFAPSIYDKDGSHLWKSVGEVWSKVLRGVSWAIGKGQKARFWWYAWLYEGTVLAAHMSPHHHLPNNVVADFITTKGHWNWPLFGSFLPTNVLWKIVASNLPNRNEKE